MNGLVESLQPSLELPVRPLSEIERIEPANVLRAELRGIGWGGRGGDYRRLEVELYVIEIKIGF